MATSRHLVLQAYGSPAILQEAAFALLSFYRQAGEDSGVEAWVYTDDPQFFISIFGDRVKTLPLPPERVTAWRGSIDFVHRVKVEMLRDFMGSRDGAALYIDTDTVFIADPRPLWEAIQRSERLMHTLEGVPASGSNPIFRKLIKFLQAESIALPGGETLRISPETPMWNAGVIGLQCTDLHLVEEVLTLTDALYAKFPKHIVEQFAFSYVLGRSGELRAAEGIIGHYWYFKEFRAMLAGFFEAHEGKGFAELSAAAAKLDPIALAKPRRRYRALPKWRRLLAKEPPLPGYP